MKYIGNQVSIHIFAQNNTLTYTRVDYKESCPSHSDRYIYIYIYIYIFFLFFFWGGGFVIVLIWNVVLFFFSQQTQSIAQ